MKNSYKANSDGTQTVTTPVTRYIRNADGTLGCVDVNLGREVATSVHLIIHIERRVLGITEVTLGICVVDSTGNLLFVVTAGENALSLLWNHQCFGFQILLWSSTVHILHHNLSSSSGESLFP